MIILNTYLHFVGVAALFALLFAEWLLYRPDLAPAEHKRLVVIDLSYGVAATLVLLTGLMRAFTAGTGPGFYFKNPAFHLMGAAFLAAAVLSFYPTRNLLRRHKALQAGERAVIAADTSARIEKILYAEFGLLLLAMLLAVLMARGVGYGWFI
jgi:putative membrane protein